MSAFLILSVAPGYEAETFADVPENSYAETATMNRRRFTVSQDAECFTVRIEQTGPSSKTEFFGLEWSERVYSPYAEGE